MVGGVVSVTVTVCVQLVMLPAASVAVHVIVVAPTGYGSVNNRPSLRLPTTETAPGQLSVAVATPGSTAVAQGVAPAPVSVITFDGHVMIGGVVSVTITVCVQFAMLPAASVAVQVIIVTPTGYGSVSRRPSLRLPTMLT
jgi:hypothetical protein